MNNYAAVVQAIKYLHGRGVNVEPYLERIQSILSQRLPVDVFNHAPGCKEIQIGVAFLPNYGHKQSVKQRDNREPKLLEKLKLERWIQDIFVRRFRAQIQALRNEYKMVKPKKLPPIPKEKDFFDELISALITGISEGIDLFSRTLMIGMDFTKPNEIAAKWVEDYTFDLVKGIDDTSLKLLQDAIGAFVDEPGYTIGDIIDLISPQFGDIRASMIAVTETTRAFAEGQKIAGEEMKREFPELTIYKTWFTNNDDRVCDICGPLDGVEMPMDDQFESEGETLDAPPAHVNCRCWIDYNTKVGNA